MKISLNWLKDYVDLPKDLEISKLAHDLTMTTVEVEGVTDLAKKFEEKFKNIVIGVVKEILPHPNADKLWICKTDICSGMGSEEIVCGGTNLKVGMKVPVACPGAFVRWHGAGNPVKIKRANVRGAESFGMICAASEIGLHDLFPPEKDGEILDLSHYDAVSGTSLAEILGLQDIIFEIDNKSLTNRPDLWGHYGIAREISAIYGLNLKELKPIDLTNTGNIKINLENPLRSPRYIGVKMDGVFVKPSPFEVRSRLWSVGIRPINAIVDITNYVMVATGQPLHAFDSGKINGNITVRHAKNTEKLLLLDGKELMLTPEDLVIADDKASIALAGIMGGKSASITPETRSVVLEIANFEPSGIRQSTMRHEIRTESSTRNEKGIDPERCDVALVLAMQMFTEFFPNSNVVAFSDNYPQKLKKSEINVSLTWLQKCLGKRISNEEISQKFKKFGFDVDFNQNIMHVTAPTWRSTGDIAIPNDIMEEVARIHGFDNFEPMPITTSFNGAINQPKIDIDRKIKEYLAFRCGMNEIFTYPWTSDEYLNALFPEKSQNNTEMLKLIAPPSENERYVRTSLLPNICQAVSKNLRYFCEFAIFESAKVFFNKDFKTLHDSRELLPMEIKNVAGAFVDAAQNVNSLFKRVKGVIEALPRYVHTKTFEFKKVQKPDWADAVVWLNVLCNGEILGNMGLLLKKSSFDCGIKNSAVMLFELNIDKIEPYPSRTNKFTHIAEYPTTEYDVSILLDSSVTWSEISEIILNNNDKDNQKSLIQDLIFVDVYKGKQVDDGKKSITFRLIIGSNEKTLTSGEIEVCVNSVICRLKKALGAELRG